MVASTLAPPAVPRAGGQEPLIEALQTEAECLTAVGRALGAQREALASGATPALDDSTRALARAMLSLEESRRRRVAETGRLTGGRSAHLDRAADRLPPALAQTLQAARDNVRRAAESAAREAAINRQVLQRALQAGDAYLQRLFALVSDPTPVYHQRHVPAERGAAPGALLSRTA
jgi:FlgN protein